MQQKLLEFERTNKLKEAVNITIYNANERMGLTRCPCPPAPPCPPPAPPCPPPAPPCPGIPGPMGPTGPAGESGLSSYATFYALMPTDNAVAIAPNEPIDFPTTATKTNDITVTSPSVFTVTTAGNYLVMFQASTTEGGQLQLTVNNTPIAYTTVGKAGENTQIVGFAILPLAANDAISVINPQASTTGITLTQNAGGTSAVAAQLVIAKLA